MHEMTGGGPQDNCERCRDLLPWYASGSLAALERGFVAEHLASCAECRRALSEWGTVAQAIVADGRAVRPTLTAAASWQRFSAQLDKGALAPRETAGLGVVASGVRHALLVMAAQVRLLRRAVWIASALGIALAAVYGALVQSVNAGDVLTFALPLIAASGAAFLYGPESDVAMELALGTPTSARTVVFGRFLLLFSYDIALALAATAWVAHAQGENVWLLSSLWLGPMALLSSASLALSLFVNPFIAGAMAAGLWISRLLRLENGASLQVAPDLLWHTSPQILALSVGLLVVALYVAPRQERPAEE